MIQITEEILRHIAPLAPKGVDVFVPYMNQAMQHYSIDTVQRETMFLAQVCHESGQFRYVREIANGKAYEGRADLGNVIEGDGVKYKGRGLIQITGRNNYRKASKDLFGDENTLVNNPLLLEAPQYAVLSAAWFWNEKGLNKYADLPDDWTSPTKKYSPFQMVTYLINGGQNGYTERANFYARAKEVIK